MLRNSGIADDSSDSGISGIDSGAELIPAMFNIAE
jgi:hypothetical protein